MPDGRRGAMLRAYLYMPAGQTGTPMTYMLNGRQYIVVAIGGQDYNSELLAFKRPK